MNVPARRGRERKNDGHTENRDFSICISTQKIFKFNILIFSVFHFISFPAMSVLLFEEIWYLFQPVQLSKIDIRIDVNASQCAS